MKKILVYPCGTEIGLEIYRSLCCSVQYELIGGSSSYDHGRFVYKNHIDGLPFITDSSGEDDISKFNKAVAAYGIDFIYPAMDGVLTVFSKYRSKFSATIIAPQIQTAEITRSKHATYRLFENKLPIPTVYFDQDEVRSFPIFVKPDVGQGSMGARKINNVSELQDIDFLQNVCMEYLPGPEYTVDCLTNGAGELVYARGRKRNRIKNGISVNAEFVDRKEFAWYAQVINRTLEQRGGWFFQLKETEKGSLKLLEISSRIAGTSAITRCIGVNLPLLTVNVFNNIMVHHVIQNDYLIELDRAYENRYKVGINYSFVYVDYDDTLVVNGLVNVSLVQFLYQCVNQNKRLVLISKHKGDLDAELSRYRLKQLFDQVLHLERNESKSDYIKESDAIFIDDSYGERRVIHYEKGIPVFDTHMVECLVEG